LGDWKNIDKVSLAQETKEVLKTHGITLNRRLGQNYLIDDFKRKKIIGFADLSPQDTVLEIGPGIGTLTIPISFKVHKLVAIEQDPCIAHILKKRLEEFGSGNVEVITGDALKIDFPVFNKIVSNLPYQISSPITFKLLEHNFDQGILMYQKEFAERMNAPVGSKHYSRLSVMLHFKATVELLDKVSPQSFIPPPRVDSTVVRLVPKKDRKIDNFFTRVCRALFQHRRKKAAKSLLESFHEIGDLDKKEARLIIQKLNPVLKEERVFKLTPQQILDISNNLKHLLKQ